MQPDDHGDAALVWRRIDFSESSRLLTLITRQEGKVHALAKGAYRAKSPFLGRLDFLNLVRPSLRARGEGRLRLLRGAELLHEPRGLREPARFLAAGWLVELLDPAFVADRPDPPLFDLLLGAVRVLERCPASTLATAIAGIELKALAGLGLLPDLRLCGACGTAPADLWLAATDSSLVCRLHRGDASRPAPRAARAWLRQLDATPARAWSELPAPGRETLTLLGAWLGSVLERPPRWREPALRAACARSRPPASSPAPG